MPLKAFDRERRLSGGGVNPYAAPAFVREM